MDLSVFVRSACRHAKPPSRVAPASETAASRKLCLSLSGVLRAATADRATLAPCGLGLFARPLMSRAHGMCSFSTLAGNLALLLRTHRGESAPTTLVCLHSFPLSFSCVLPNLFGLLDTGSPGSARRSYAADGR